MIDKIFLDSGAFSVHTKGKEVDLQKYISFVHRHRQSITTHACLDVMGDMKSTLENQKIMEVAGLDPLPVFHRGEDFKLLKNLIWHYKYIALGGLVSEGISAHSKIRKYLDQCWQIICNTPDGLPKCNVHGFGITSIKFLTRYPWYSVDSITWKAAAAYGDILIPTIKKGSYDYIKGRRISIVEKEGEVEGKHFLSFSKREQKKIIEYLASIDIKYGSKKEKGVSNHWVPRRKVNIVFYYKIAEALGKLPIEEKMGFKKTLEPML